MPSQEKTVFADAHGDASVVQAMLESKVANGRNDDFLVINYHSKESEPTKPSGPAKS